MTWRAPPNDSAGFWGLIRRELPAFISVPLHISIGIHAKGEADPFLPISPSSVRSSVRSSGSLRFYTQGEGWQSLAEIVGFSKDVTVCCGGERHQANKGAWDLKY